MITKHLLMRMFYAPFNLKNYYQFYIITLWLSGLFIVFALPAYSTHDPFSKVVITSQSAHCSFGKKNAEHPDEITCDYRERVRVELADGSVITADNLHVILDKSVKKKQKTTAEHIEKSTVSEESSSPLRRIFFKEHVYLKQGIHEAWAHTMEVDPATKTCLLKGNVKIIRSKEKPTDYPLEIKSDRAVFNLTTKEATLLGDEEKPVSTIIDITGNQLLKKKSLLALGAGSQKKS